MLIKDDEFISRLHKRLSDEEPDRQFSKDDLKVVINALFRELSSSLKRGYTVRFENVMTFYLKAVKRKCYNMKTGNHWFSYKRRMRFKPSDTMRSKTEVELSEQEYENETK